MFEIPVVHEIIDDRNEGFCHFKFDDRKYNRVYGVVNASEFQANLKEILQQYFNSSKTNSLVTRHSNQKSWMTIPQTTLIVSKTIIIWLY